MKNFPSGSGGSSGAKISLEERERLNQELNALEVQIAGLKDGHASVEGKLSALRLMGVDGASNADRSARLAQLEHVRSSLLLQWIKDESDASLDAYYRAMIPKLRDIFDNIAGLSGELDLAVAEKMEDLRVRLEREKRAVEAEKSRYLTTRSEVSKTAGDIAARTALRRTYRFSKCGEPRNDISIKGRTFFLHGVGSFIIHKKDNFMLCMFCNHKVMAGSHLKSRLPLYPWMT